MKAEQGIGIATDSRQRYVAGYGLMEHAARGRVVYAFAADAKADDVADEYVDDHQDPMTPKEDRFVEKGYQAR